MLLSSSKFATKAQDVLRTELDIEPVYLQLTKFQGGNPHEKVALEKTGPGSAGMMLYTSGTTNRPVRTYHTPLDSSDVSRLTSPFRKESSYLSPS